MEASHYAKGCGVSWCLLMSCAVAAAQPSTKPVRIDGGTRDGGANYTWEVKNQSDQPIVRVEFPHYHADTFRPPEKWEQECTNLMVVGGKNAPGVCAGFVVEPRRGIQAGRSGEFYMRINRRGAMARPGDVTVHFADGSTFVVRGVTLPTQQGFIERYIAALGLAAIFGLIILIRLRSSKRKTAEELAPDAAAPPDDAAS